MPRLTDAEQMKILDAYDKGTYTDVRDQALVACYLATGRRFREILELRLEDLNLLSGEIQVRAKGETSSSRRSRLGR